MAAANNAEWCDLVCGTHGAQTRFDEGAWTSRTRTPPGYPDAVTLVPDPSVSDLLARIDTAVGCSIKDSFASLDMTAYGFRVLFDAQWIVHRATAIPPSPDRARWQVVREEAGSRRGSGHGVATIVHLACFAPRSSTTTRYRCWGLAPAASLWPARS
jgi:hypothetical protein